MTQNTTAKRRPSTARAVSAWGAIAAVALVWLIVHVTSGGGAKFTATVMGYNPVNPADLAVYVQVTNTSSKPGTPACTINAQDASYAYHGIDIVTLQGSVAAGQTTHFEDNVTITSQGAQYVTQVTVSC
jgi:hypothetical protein